MSTHRVAPATPDGSPETSATAVEGDPVHVTDTGTGATDHTPADIAPAHRGPEAQLAHPLRTLAADPQRYLLRIALALIALQFAVRLTMALRGWFVGDDYAFIGRSYEYSALSPQYFGLAYAAHVMPGSWIWVWICSHLAPYNFVLPTVADAIVQALTAWVMLRLLIALFDRRWAILIPLTLYLFTALTIPAFVWWAAALNQTPQQLAIAAALLNHVQYLRTGRRWRGYAGVACMVAGLAFSEKTLLVSGLIFALTFAYFAGGTFGARLRTVLARHWRVWAAYAVVGAAYLTYYELAVPSPIAHVSPTESGASTLVGYQVFHSLIPSFLGGPWRWAPLGTNAALAHPATVWVDLTTVVFALLVAATVLLNHRAAWGWLVLLGYEAVNATLLALSRAALVGPALGLEFRYATDLAIVATVCISLATIPLASAFVGSGGQLLVPRASTRARLQLWRESEFMTTMPPMRPAPIAATLVAVLAASSVYSSWRYTDIFAPNTGRTLIHNAVRESHSLPSGTLVSDTPVDQAAVWSMVYPYTLPSRLLRPLGVTLNYIKVGESTEYLAILDATGHFREAAIQGYTAAPGPDPNCGYRLDAEPRTIRMPAKTIVPWNWLIRIGYLSTGTGAMTVTAGTTTATVHVHSGAGTLYLLVAGVVQNIRFGGLSNGARVCTDAINVGTAVPIPGTTVHR